ncbi:MAG: quinone oxidoreductase [Anaerolineae bacterium]|nr:quinone oxidoreductase [Anaerolineales bacterium]MCQ3974028.1 quinone oxidoreductase [Anaerolineae bacterium]
MKAIRVHEFGGPEMLRCDDLPVPEPGQGEVLVKMAAAGVNFIDIYHRIGIYQQPLPTTLGVEGAGTVAAVGPGVTEFKPGDPVAFSGPQGADAEYTLVPAAKLVPVPAALDLSLAAAVLLQGMTAHFLTHSTFPLKKGDITLIHAAAGGVGLLLVQMAKMLGATVIGTTSSEEKAQLVREAGADHVILYTQADFEAETKQFSGGRGVDVVYDSVGQTTFEKSLNVLRMRGMLVLFGQSSGKVPPIDPLILNSKGSLFLTRPTVFHYTATREELLWRSGDVFNWVAAGQLQVRVDRQLALADAAEAHRLLASRQTAGKLLLLP